MRRSPSAHAQGPSRLGGSPSGAAGSRSFKAKSRGQSPPLSYSHPLPVASKPAYDLFVLIDADVPEERRSGILDGIRSQVASGGGDLKSDVDWGVRKLAFEIAHRGDAY